MKKFFEDFKKFAMRGNIMDLAVGVAVGGAFTKVVSSLVSDLVMPLIGLIAGGVNFKDLKFTLEKADGSVWELPYGLFLQNVFDFLVVAFCIFVVIHFMGKLARLRHEKAAEEAAQEPPKKPDDVVLLEEIRDLLKEKAE